MEKLTHAQLREILSYDPETGWFTWLVSNSQFVGRIAGHRHDPGTGQAYWLIKIDRVQHKAHRLAWFYMTGKWPEALIDHRDCDGLNNVWANLREADSSTNTQNSRCRSDSRAGLKGVNFNARLGKWTARIKAGARRIYLGSFGTPEAAHAAYKTAAEKAFGEFARAA